MREGAREGGKEGGSERGSEGAREGGRGPSHPCSGSDEHRCSRFLLSFSPMFCCALMTGRSRLR